MNVSWIPTIEKVGCCCGDVAKVQIDQDQMRNRFVRLVTIGNGIKFRGFEISLLNDL